MGKALTGTPTIHMREAVTGTPTIYMCPYSTIDVSSSMHYYMCPYAIPVFLCYCI